MEFTESIKQEETKIESVKMEFSPQQNALDKQQQEIEAREKSLQKEFVSKVKVASHRLYVFPRLAPAARTWQWLYIFPRLAPAAYFPALGTGCLFSRTWHRLRVFPRLAPAAYFPALGTGYTFSRAWHWLHVLASSCDWFFGLILFAVVGQMWLIGFGFTI